MIENLEDPLEDSNEEAFIEGGRTKIRRPYSKLPFDLDSNDLSSGGVHKMLLGEIERLSEENGRLQILERRFHETDKKCAVLETSRKTEALLEILYTIAIAVGAALLGWIPGSSTKSGTIFIVVVASLLFISALLAKWKTK